MPMPAWNYGTTHLRRALAGERIARAPLNELVVAQGGLKIRLADDQTPVDVRAATPPSVPNGFERLRRGTYFIGGNRAGMGFEGSAIPLERLINILTIETGRMVMDKTGLNSYTICKWNGRPTLHESH